MSKIRYICMLLVFIFSSCEENMEVPNIPNKLTAKLSELPSEVVVGNSYNVKLVATSSEIVSIKGGFIFAGGTSSIDGKDIPLEEWLPLSSNSATISIKCVKQGLQTLLFQLKDGKGQLFTIEQKITAKPTSYSAQIEPLKTEVTSIDIPIPFVVTIDNNSPRDSYNITSSSHELSEDVVSGDTVYIKMPDFGMNTIICEVTDEYGSTAQVVARVKISQLNQDDIIKADLSTIKDYNKEYPISLLFKDINTPNVHWCYQSDTPIVLTLKDGTAIEPSTPVLLDSTVVDMLVNVVATENLSNASTGNISIQLDIVGELITKNFEYSISKNTLSFEFPTKLDFQYNEYSELSTPFEFTSLSSRSSDLTMKIDYDNTFGTLYYKDIAIVDGSSIALDTLVQSLSYKAKKEGETNLSVVLSDHNKQAISSNANISIETKEMLLTLSPALNTTYYNNELIDINLFLVDGNLDTPSQICTLSSSASGELYINGVKQVDNSFYIEPNKQSIVQFKPISYGAYNINFKVEDWRGATAVSHHFNVPCKLALTVDGKGYATWNSGNGTVYQQGDKTTLSARDGVGSFNGWYDENGTLLSSARSYEVNFTTDKDITAKFVGKNVVLEIFKQSDSDVITGDGNYIAGDNVTISAHSNSSLRLFSHWEDAYTFEILSNKATYNFVMPSFDLSLRAVFSEQADMVRIEVDYDGTLGTVQGEGLVQRGVTTQVSAIASNNAEFKGWFDSSNRLVSNNNLYQFTPTSDMRLTAKFEKPEYTLKLQHKYFYDTNFHTETEQLSEENTTVQKGDIITLNTNILNAKKYEFVGFYERGKLISTDANFKRIIKDEYAVINIEARYIYQMIDITLNAYGGLGVELILELVSTDYPSTVQGEVPKRIIANKEITFRTKYGTKYKMLGNEATGSRWDRIYIILRGDRTYLNPNGNIPEYEWLGTGGNYYINDDENSFDMRFIEDTYVKIDAETISYRASLTQHVGYEIARVITGGDLSHGQIKTFEAVVYDESYEFIHHYDIGKNKIIIEPKYSVMMLGDVQIETIFRKKTL